MPADLQSALVDHLSTDAYLILTILYLDDVFDCEGAL